MMSVRNLRRFIAAMPKTNTPVNPIQTLPTWATGPVCEPPIVPVQVRGRRFLPDSDNPKLPEFASPAKPGWPHVCVPGTEGSFAIEDWASMTRDYLDEHLHKHGAILFRNVPLDNHGDFNDFVEALGWRTKDTMAYLKSMNARSMTSTAVSEHVRTASDDPPEYTIEPHSEYHTVGCPPRIMLYCVTPPTHGGEWPVTDTRKLYKDLDPAVTEKFERLGCLYKVFYESKENAIYNCWQGNIAPTKEQVEEYLEMLEYEWSWDEKNALSYWKVIPVVKAHPVTGEKTWFNQIQAHHNTFYKGTHPKYVDQPEGFNRWPVDSFYGDGTEIEKEVLDHIRECVWKNTVVLPPKKGDLLFCDNHLALHGRMGFKEATPREIYVACAYD